jgi:sortase A
MEAKKPKQRNWLRTFNNFLSVVVLLVAVYIIVMPFLPKIQFWVKQTTHAQPPLVKQNLPDAPQTTEVIPAENTLVVPTIDMQVLVHEGATKTTLRQGVWHRPNTSDPTKGSNTVLVGHRFTYANPIGVFYNLDKIKVGDPIVLYWQGKKYSYKVKNIITVTPDRIDIEAPTKQPRLTLYTCTPLWTSKFRLVIQAELEAQP